MTLSGLVDPRKPRVAKPARVLHDPPEVKPESTEGGSWGQPLKKREGAPMNLG